MENSDESNMKENEFLWENLQHQIIAVIKATSQEDVQDILESNFDPCRRAYRTQKNVFKVSIRKSIEQITLRACTLREESDILKMLRGMSSVPNQVTYIEKDSIEFLVLKRFKGVSFDKSSLSNVEKCAVLFKILVCLIKIAFRGVSHNDICFRNVLISQTKEIMIIDFDQSTKHSVPVAFLNSIFGMEFNNAKSHGSYMSLIKQFIKGFLTEKILRLYRNFRNKNYYEDICNKLPVLDVEADERLLQIRKAWEIAQKSDASSPGVKQAYYSYDFNGVHFPGERSWKDRWEVLRKLTNYRGKRILELGCNMGLLAAFLIKESDAGELYGVDVDPDIIESAKIVDSVLGVKVRREVIDLDSKENWEERFRSFNPDIIFALNVLNWINEKDRLLRFLGGYREVILEGHDAPEIESAKFSSVGFTKYEVVEISDRNRPIMIFRK